MLLGDAESAASSLEQLDDYPGSSHFRSPCKWALDSQSYNNSPLINLKLGDVFNQPLGDLPSSLAHLSFGKSFNNSVDTSSPASNLTNQ